MKLPMQPYPPMKLKLLHFNRRRRQLWRNTFKTCITCHVMRLVPASASAAAVATLLAACASPDNLVVETVPPAGNVQVVSAHGVSWEGAAPLEVPVDFNYDEFYEIRATGGDGVTTETLRVYNSRYTELPHLRPDARRIVVSVGGVVVPEPEPAAVVAEINDLQITTEPGGAFVEVFDAGGALLATGESPLMLAADFAETARYDIRANHMGELEGYDAAAVNLDARGFNALPVGAPGSRRLTLVLEKTGGESFADDEFVLIEEPKQHFSPRGDAVVTLLQRRAYKNITEAGGAVPTLIHEFSPDHVLIGMSISPDGKRIAFAQSARAVSAGAADGVLESPSHLYVLHIGARGSVSHITTQNFQDGHPAYSPDGKYLFFSSNRRRKNLSDILRISAAGRSGISDVHVNHHNAHVMRPSVAKNGCVAMEFALYDEDTQRFGATHYIWTVGGVNGYPTQVAEGYQPSIAPDAKRIAYIGADGNLWMVNTNGGNPTQLTSSADKIARRYMQFLSAEERAEYEAARADVNTAPNPPFSQPSWSSDSKHILYTSMESNDASGRPNEDVWALNVANSAKQQLTTNGSVDKYPLMSPDKKRVYFVSNRGNRWGLWRVNAAVGK